MSEESKITYGQLVNLLEDQVTWMRVYLDYKHEQSHELMSWPAIQTSLEWWGKRKVHSIYPGYRFVFVYLEEE